ncbi:MAG: phosphatase PAP2 family protein [Tepidisphaeraceae bacterium]
MTVREEIVDHVKRMNAQVTPAADWADHFRVWPRWWVMVPMIALMGPMIVFDGLARDLLGAAAPGVKHDSPWWFLAKQGGEYWLTLLAALLLGLLHPWRWRAASLPLIASVVTGLIAAALKWSVGRHRPVTAYGPFDLEPFRRGLRGFFDQSNLSFPSGHGVLAFSTAAILTLLIPRGWWVWFALATLCAIQRVAELAHYPSDALGSAIVGILGARAAVWISLWVTGQR